MIWNRRELERNSINAWLNTQGAEFYDEDVTKPI